MTLPGLEFLVSLSTKWDLATWQAYDNPFPQTSQLRAVQGLGTEITALFGGVRCLAGDTLVETLEGPRRIDSITEPTEVWSLVNGERVQRTAYPMPVKGPDPLCRVTLSDGSHFMGTPAHRVLSADGAWLPLSALRPGSELCRPPSSSAPSPSGWRGGGPHCSRTTPGSLCDCPACRRSGGARPPSRSGSGQGGPPSRADAQAHGRLGLSGGPSGPSGGLGSRSAHSRRSPLFGHPSSCDDPGLSDTLAAAFGSRASCTAFRWSDGHTPAASQPPCETPSRLRSSAEVHQWASRAAVVLSGPSSYLSVVDVVYHQCYYHFDLNVPSAGNYFANGAIHHNSGKTAAGFEIDLAHALGGDHPAVQAWMARNRIEWTIPDGPGKVWVIAASSDASRRFHRPHFSEVIPDHLADWYNETGRGEARVFIDVPGYSQKAEIWFKSNDQKLRTFKGDAIRLGHFDEEPDQDKWEETSLRTGYNGNETIRMLLTMQPDGMTWVHRELVAKGEAPSIRCHWLDSLDNTALPIEVRAQLKVKFDALPENVRKARKEGKFVNLEGLVYPGFSRRVHVVEPFDIPESWPRFLGCDWGLGNPTAILWGALSPDGQVVVYAEHYKAKWVITKHARIVNARKPKPKRGWGDPRDVQSGAELGEQTRIRIRPVPIKNRNLGIDVVSIRLAVDDVTHRPGVIVFETCKHTIEEMEGYQWEEGKNEPKQVNDHTCDALRYLLVGLAKWTKRRHGGGRAGIDSGEALRRPSPWRQ